MTRAYYDTAFLVKLYCRENGSTEVLSHSLTVEGITSGRHAHAELASTLHRKRREGALTRIQTREILEQFHDDLATGFISLCDFTEGVLRQIEAVFDLAPVTIHLRAADALHLACASAHGFSEIYSNDRHLLLSAPLFGLKATNLLVPH